MDSFGRAFRALLMVFLAYASDAHLAQASPSFPYWTGRLEVDAPTQYATYLNVDVEVPAASVPRERARWSGEWSGWIRQFPGPICAIRLVVANVTQSNAEVVWAFACGEPQYTTRLAAHIDESELIFTTLTNASLRLRFRSDSVLEIASEAPGNIHANGVLKRVPVGSSGAAPLPGLPTFPDFISRLGVDRKSVYSVVLNVDPTSPSADVDPVRARWSGAWSGWIGDDYGSPPCAVQLVVSSITPTDAEVVWAFACGRPQYTTRVRASVVDGELRFMTSSRASIRARFRSNDVVEITSLAAGPVSASGVMSRKSTSVATPAAQPASGI